MLHMLAFLQMPSFGEWIIIGVVGVLLFGKRLPEVGKSLGKGIVEFKKGLKGIEDDVDVNATQPRATPTIQQAPAPQQPAIASPEYKFDPYTGKPIEQPAQQTTRVG